MERRDPPTSAIYAIGYLTEQIVQLHIFDTSTLIIAPSSAEVLVGQEDGAMIPDMSLLGLADASAA